MPSSKYKLTVAVWNAASGDRQYKKTRRVGEAAAEMCGKWCDVVICPECDSEVRQHFVDKGYSTVESKKGLQIFYWGKNLKPECWRSFEIKGGGKHRNGVAISQLFKKTDSCEHVLVTGVHAGHYGNSKSLVCNDRNMQEDAWVAMEQIRKLQCGILSKGMAQKVIVGGDFNELGELIKANCRTWMPLPLERNLKPMLRHVRGTIHVKSTVKLRGQMSFDQIWVGGDGIDTSAVIESKGKAYGSDHFSVVMSGI
eukprot:TRINITY_DN87305_c0_g1_i1.p1 TRINITY_DN87305_c0_g1~~TRINITY_DN87305_c0_g1_i1.p1  ORF type:complete len:254 (-),score=39.27 TRINITY_DN87305_c0_g1_i1:111-872(-)